MELFPLNQSSTLAYEDFISEAIEELKSCGWVIEVKAKLHVCSSLSVVENRADKKRLVVNLCHVNKFLCKLK